MLNGEKISTDPNVLADPTKGRVVGGLATDGVAQVVIQIPATSVGQQFSLSLDSDSQCPPTISACVDDYGLLFDPVRPPLDVFSDQGATKTIVTAVSTSFGPIAFAAYRAPVDFVRPGQANLDIPAAQRQITLNLDSNVTGSRQHLQITLVRPPLIFVHGFSTDSTSWNTFTPIINDTSKYGIFKINYGAPLYNVHCEPLTDLCFNDPALTVNGQPVDVRSTDPPISIYRIYAFARQSHLGFSFNAAYVAFGILQAINDFDLGNNPLSIPVAGVKVDVVAHSMGGLVTRYWTTYPAFLTGSNYNQGYFHKLITLGTPHWAHLRPFLVCSLKQSVHGALPRPSGASSFRPPRLQLTR